MDEYTQRKLKEYAVDELADKKRAAGYKRLDCEDWLAEHILDHYDVESYTESDLDNIIVLEREKRGEL